MPLTSRKLNAKDCKGLVDKITARIKHWSSRLLSYASRFQLIKSVLISMQTYWCSVRLWLSKSTKLICNAFLWHGHDENAKGARVSWDSVCKTKSEGGLGLQDLSNWNLACVLRNLWDIITSAGSLWVAWVEAYVLKGSSVWDVQIKNVFSCNVRKLLQLQELADTFIDRRSGRDIWKLKGSKYSVTLVWKELKPRFANVSWARLIWTTSINSKALFYLLDGCA